MRLRPIALSAAVAAVALGALAAPAQAAPDDEGQFVGVLLPEQIAVIAGKTKTVRAEVLNIGSKPAENVVADFSDIDPSLKLTLPANCDATSCPVGDIAANGRKVLTFTIGSTGDKLAANFQVGVDGLTSEVTVVRSEGGIDLELEPIDDPKIGRGQSAALPITVHNAGSEPVSTVGLVVAAENGLTPLGSYRNCLPLDEVEDEIDDTAGIVCLFDEEFAPGATFRLPADSPVKLRVNKDAGGPYTYSGAAIAVGLNDEDAALLARQKTGKVLTLDAVSKASGLLDEEPDDLNIEDNIATFGVSVGKSVADSAAVGATISGKGGDTRTIKVGVRNLGPTTVIPFSDDVDWFPGVQVTIPAGLKLTEVDPFCMPGSGVDVKKPGSIDGRDYLCVAPMGLGVGKLESFTFTGTLTGDESTAGSVVVDGGVQDPNAKNDKAAITVALTGQGGEGGEGGGGLPVTGAPTGWVALGGALLLLAGGVAAYVFRRRRIVTTL
ncbi:LPXTG cell wall anchor domain-containing protein [Actinoplanes sp. M2I2]|uniref:LPXTG cell wall anchor domain-containing protein n=1 Tax=Actinoplanes sp. M2I2 TaxID=1734444 RepID=UPI00202130BA|nr:LPXTG cell wall anchor domain-containing protein [Actinoplanes sp. M2I2]